MLARVERGIDGDGAIAGWFGALSAATSKPAWGE
jgi:hypothetical protein